MKTTPKYRIRTKKIPAPPGPEAGYDAIIAYHKKYSLEDLEKAGYAKEASAPEIRELEQAAERHLRRKGEPLTMSKDDEAKRKRDLKRKLREIDARATQKLDQNLAEVREEYESLGKVEQKRFREWVSQLAAAKPPETGIYTSARIHVGVQTGPDEWKDLEVSVDSLRRAIVAWDRGKDYLPKWSDV